MGRAFAVYTALRALLFAGTYAVLLLAGLRGLVALAAALLVSSIASPFALRRQRDEVAAALAARSERRTSEQARLRGLLDGGTDPSRSTPGGDTVPPGRSSPGGDARPTGRSTPGGDAVPIGRSGTTDDADDGASTRRSGTGDGT